MNILTIDTVLNKTYAALLINEKEIFKTIESDENNYHSAYLISVLDKILKENSSSMKDINYIGENTGVGSFTGIRVGLSIAKIISNRLNIKAVPYTTVELLKNAYNFDYIMIDARRNSVFYSKDGKNTELISYENALDILNKENKTYICDNSLFDKFKDFQTKLISYENDNKNFAKTALELVKTKIQNGETTNFAGIKPTYIQTPPIFSKN